MSRIDATAALQALLRSHTAWPVGTNQSRPQSIASPNSADVPNVSPHGAREGDNSGPGGADIDARLVRQLKGISHQDPDKRRKAFRFFLESVLRKEFGEAWSADAGFKPLVDQVEQLIQSDPGLLQGSLAAADHLLESLHQRE